VKVWEAMTGKLLLTYRGSAAEVWTASWLPDGKYIASVSAGGGPTLECNDRKAGLAASPPATFTLGHLTAKVRTRCGRASFLPPFPRQMAQAF